jgi:PQQ system protein
MIRPRVPLRAPAFGGTKPHWSAPSVRRQGRKLVEFLRIVKEYLHQPRCTHHRWFTRITLVASVLLTKRPSVPVFAQVGRPAVCKARTRHSLSSPGMRCVGRGLARRRVVAVLLAAAPALLSACDYVRLLRPGVLKQLNPRVVRLVNYLPEVDDPNAAILARLPGHGGLAYARAGRDGVMRVTVRAPANEYIWYPSLIVMPRAGELELEFQNQDAASHAAMLHSNGELEVLWLPARTAGRARIRLDEPGLYTFSCPVANHGGRGMLGLILVEGDVPATAKLDRPPQRRP